ncbi:MAG: apolipoprotein N-acyltransferase [Planctomycetota bacterium]
MQAPTPKAADEDGSLGPASRLLLVSAAWAALLAGSPGVLLPEGHPLGAIAFAAWWSAAAVRPGRRAWLVEWAVASLAFATTMWWLSYISWAAVPPTGIGMGAYAMAAGVAARRAARVLPAPLAAALAWVAFETLRDLMEPPVGMGWLRLGHLAAAKPYLAESARWWGVAGVSWSLALTGACLPWVFGGQRPGILRSGGAGTVPGRLHWGRTRAALVAAGSLGLSFVLGLLGAPRTEAGPTLALIQPNIAQSNKTAGQSWASIVQQQRDLTRAAQVDGPVDLVCWSETMLDVNVVADGVYAALDAGADLDPWRELPVPTVDFLRGEQRYEELRVLRDILGLGPRQGDLSAGTAFLAGAEEFRAVGDRIRRFNSAVLWSPEGQRSSYSKRHTVPVGETMYGLERFAWARTMIGGYIADLAAADDPRPLVFEDRGGRTWRVGTPICFDNAYIDTFRPDVDFHVVLSNEAWYRTSWELDQMLAFSRLAAIASGRAVARCTNSGVTYACDARGRELARLVVDGVDREVPGYLRVALPVPSDPAAVPLFARYSATIRWLFVALGIGAGLWGASAGSAGARRAVPGQTGAR